MVPLFYPKLRKKKWKVREKPYLCTMTPEEKDERYMRMALDEARQAYDAGEIPIGCIVVCKDRVVARSHNLTETLSDVTAHAEMQAITAAANTLGGKYLTDCTLYVTVEPCPMCAGALGWAQVACIVFGCADEKRGYQAYAPRVLHPKTTVIKGTLEAECRQLMQDFFRSRR
jgi:tRNA(adenine34) deaminase